MEAVTILIPTCDQPQHLAAAIASALAQTHTDREVLVVDAGSTDQTPAILDRFGPAICRLRTAERSIPAALNLGVRSAQGDWIAWLSPDDSFLPAKLARQLAYAEAHPYCDLVYTDWYQIDGDGQVLSHLQSPTLPTRSRLISGLARNCVINRSTTLVRRTAYERVGPFDEQLTTGYDWAMWRRLAQAHLFGHLPLPLVRSRWP